MTAIFVSFMVVVVVVGTTTLVKLLRHSARARTSSQLDIAYLSVKSLLMRYSSHHEGPLLLSDVIPKKQSEISRLNVAMLVTSRDGKLLWESQKGVEPSDQDKQSWRWRSLVVNNQILYLGSPPGIDEISVLERAWALVALGILVILGTAVGTWWMVGRTLMPIRTLARQAEHASHEELDFYLQPPSDDSEMVELVTTFNSLLSFLGEEARRRQRFYAIASHEMRTPLQALSGHLELSLSRPRSNEEYQETLQELLLHTKRLRLLVQALLQLYQIESDAVPAPVKVNLTEVVNTQAKLLESWQRDRELTLTSSLAEITTPVPPGHFDILARNVLENAVKYSLRGSTITVNLQRSGEKVLFTVSNAYNPKQQAQKQRARDSHGLGMEICQAIVQTNQWSWHVDKDDGTMKVTVEL